LLLNLKHAGKIGKQLDRILADTQYLVELSKAERTLYTEINNGLLESNFIKNPLTIEGVVYLSEVVDYCFRHFSLRNDEHFPFEIMPKVLEFANYLKKTKGQKVLSLLSKIP